MPSIFAHCAPGEGMHSRMTDVTFQLRYGSDLTYECSLESDRVVARHLPPPALIDLPARIAEALAAPLEFPSLHQAIVPGDDVTIVLERDTPAGRATAGCRLGRNRLPGRLSGPPDRPATGQLSGPGSPGSAFGPPGRGPRARDLEGARPGDGRGVCLPGLDGCG